eukprot:397031_1
MSIYLMLNGCITCLAAVIHFIFIYQYLIGNTYTLDDYPFFCCIQLETCIFLWCLMVIDDFRHYIHDFYWIILLVIYAYLIFILFVSIRIYYNDPDIQFLVDILSSIQCIFMLIMVAVYFALHISVNYPVYLMRSMLLLIMIRILTTDEWTGVYKIWFLSFALTQYLNLYVGEFVIPSRYEPKEYKHLAAKKRMIFQSMASTVIDYYYDTPDYVCSTWQSADNVVTNKQHVTNESIFRMSTVYNNVDCNGLLSYVRKCYEQNNLIGISILNPNPMYAHITLSHEYNSNHKYHLDVSLWEMIRKEAVYYQSKTRNEYFDTDDIIVILLFIKFPLLRMLLNQYLLYNTSSVQHFSHFYKKLSFIHHSVDVQQEVKYGYTILNSQISRSRTCPIIFCEDIVKMFDFASTIRNQHQGIICSVFVRGKFIPISLFASDFEDMFIVIIPVEIQIYNEQVEDDQEVIAQLVWNKIQLEKMVETGNIVDLQKNLTAMKYLINRHVLNKLLRLYWGLWGSSTNQIETQILSNVLFRLEDMHILATFLLKINSISFDLNEFFSFIWLEYADNNIDKISIHKLRCICQDIEQEPAFDMQGARQLHTMITSEQDLQKMKELITNEMLINSLILFLGANASSISIVQRQVLHSISTILLHLEDMDILVRLCFCINTMNITNLRQFFSFIWIEFANNCIDEMAINKVREICTRILQCDEFNEQGANEYVRLITTDLESKNDKNEDIEKMCQTIKHLVTRESLTNVLISYREQYVDEDEKAMLQFVSMILLNIDGTFSIMKALWNDTSRGFKNMKELYLVIWMEYIDNNIDETSINNLKKISNKDTFNNGVIHSVIEIKKMINSQEFTDTYIKLPNVIDQITSESLSKWLISWRGDDFDESEIKLLSEFLNKLQNINVLVNVLFNIQTMDINMKELFGMIWLEFINNDIDKMSIIKLLRLCQEIEQETEFCGQLLLEHETNGILNQLPSDISQIKWIKYIQKYIYTNLPKKKKDIILAKKPMSKEQSIEKFLDIMYQYDQITNIVKYDNDKDYALLEAEWQQIQNIGEQDDNDDEDDDDVILEMEHVHTPQFPEQNDLHQKSKEKQQLLQLFDLINSDFDMSQIMNVFFDLQQKDVTALNKIKKYYQCTLKQCNILDSVINTRKYGLRSRIPLKISDNHVDLQLSLKECCIMEMLDFIHLRLFHKDSNYRKKIPNRAGLDTSALEIEHKPEKDEIDVLFIDTVAAQRDSKFFQLFCNENEYDSEALYDDIFPDLDAQSNIYWFFKNNVRYKIKEYDLLKDNISKYTINPPDKQAIKRNLIDLDFGDHIIEWDVKPKFLNVKQEWTENEFFPIQKEIYESLLIKSKFVANFDRNKTTYNLSINDILTIKVYTDTNELQGNFRQAFRSSSKGTNRRCQFYHWATNISIIFLKIEIGNRVNNHNKEISGKTLYHGLDRLFNTRGLVRQFNGTLSTTWELSVAKNFAGDGGMILQINKEVNSKNVNALEVDWISCHDNEHEVLLMNPAVTIQKAYVFSRDFDKKLSYLKVMLLSTIRNTKDLNMFINLSGFFKSPWIESCLEEVIVDKEFVHKIKLFEPRESLKNMSLFQFIFFECYHYQIAKYVVDNGYKNIIETFEMIMDTDFFTTNNDWVESVDRSKKLSTKYPCRMCKMDIIYEYDTDNTINKHFGTKLAKSMLKDTNLILQYIDQRKLYKMQKDLTITINMQIKYQCAFGDGDKSDVRCWRFDLSNKFSIPNKFKWRVNRKTILTHSTICVSSLWIRSQLSVEYDPNKIDKTVRFLCEDHLLIDEKSAIELNTDSVILCNGLGVKGKINNEQKILILANSTNLTEEKIFKEKIKRYQLAKFAFINKTQTQNKSFNIENCSIDYLKIHRKIHDGYMFEYIEQMPLIQFVDTESQIKYLKNKLLTTKAEQNDDNDDDEQKYPQDDIFNFLSQFFKNDSNRNWLINCIECIIQDKPFIESCHFFLSQKYLKGMSIFQFIFFEGGYYDVANYVKKYEYLNDNEICDMLLDFEFFKKDDENWTQVIDSNNCNKLCLKYLPAECKINAIYQYDEDNAIHKTFETEQALQMLINPNLLLQYVDQRTLYRLNKTYAASQQLQWEGLILSISIVIKYELKEILNEINVTSHCWEHQLSEIKFKIGKKFNWKLQNNSSFTEHYLYTSSLWITNNSCIDNVAQDFTIICEQNLLIDENSSICMDGCGLKGAYYNNETQTVIY